MEIDVYHVALIVIIEKKKKHVFILSIFYIIALVETLA